MSLRKSQSFCSPSMNPDTAASQLNADLSIALDRHAPLKQRTRMVGKFDSRWLSSEDIEARKEQIIIIIIIKLTIYMAPYAQTN